MAEPLTEGYAPCDKAGEPTSDHAAPGAADGSTGQAPTLALGGPAASATPVGRRRRFTIVRHHASGGLGRVSVARDETLGRQVALKEILPELLDRPGARERFLAEAEITGVGSYRRELANTYTSLGTWHLLRQEFIVTKQLFREAITHLDQLVKGRPAAASYRQRLAMAHTSLALLHDQTREYAQAAASYERGRALQEELVRTRPGVPDYRYELA